MPRDLQRFFRAEARDLIDRLESGFERLDGGDNQDVLKELLRLAHTLKGAARVAGHAPVATTVHQLEEILPHAAAGHADVLA
ncbi:MAG: Hpt domain-containing protein, partial [Vicinamibacterales bacterium]